MLHHAAKARVEHTIDAMAPGVAEQLAGKAKAEAVGKVEEIHGRYQGGNSGVHPIG